MMKKRTLIGVLLALILALGLALPSFAAGASLLADEAGLLSAGEAAALHKRLLRISELYGCDTVVLTVQSTGSMTLEEYADSFFANGDYGRGEKSNCLLLSIDPAGQEWRLDCWGEVPAFDSAGLTFISDRLDEAGLTLDGKSAAALDTFANWCERFYAQAEIIGVPYGEGSLPSPDIAAKPGVLLRDPGAKLLLADEAGLLGESEAAALLEKLESLSAKWKNDIVIVTVDTIGSQTPEAFADDWFDYGGYGQGESFDGLLLLIYKDKDPPGGYISTSGGAIGVFTDAGIQYIGKQVRANGLDSGDYAAAFNRFADCCDQFFAQAETGKSYDTGSLPQAKRTSADYIAVLLVCFGAGMIIAAFFTGGMKKKLKTVRKKHAAAEYLRPGSLQVIYANEQFLHKNVTSVYRPPQSSSGGSSTHSGSSGRSHGGGGF